MTCQDLSIRTHVTAGVPMTGYLSVVGDSWAVAHPWRQTFPDEPFLGVRVDGRATWVLFEPRTADGPLPPSTLREIRRAFEEAGDGWIDENVFIHETPSLGAGHRLARRVVRILRSDCSTSRETEAGAPAPDHV